MRDTTPDLRRAFPKPLLRTRFYEQVAEQMADAISELIGESRIESLTQPGRPRDPLAGHLAMHGHMTMVSDVALLRDQP